MNQLITITASEEFALDFLQEAASGVAFNSESEARMWVEQNFEQQLRGRFDEFYLMGFSQLLDLLVDDDILQFRKLKVWQGA